MKFDKKRYPSLPLYRWIYPKQGHINFWC